MRSGRAGGTVSQMWRTTPGPSRSASTTRSPGSMRRFGAPLRPPWAVPPAPRAPVGFSKVAARESRLVSMNAGLVRSSGMVQVLGPPGLVAVGSLC